MNHEPILGYKVLQNKFIRKPFQVLKDSEDIQVIIEIGTHQGGFALWLRQMFPLAYIITIDNVYRSSLLKGGGIHTKKDRDILFKEQNINFILSPYQDPKVLIEIRAAIAMGQALILCDNGSKPDEFSYLTRQLKRGDIIGVHDYALSWQDFKENIEGKYWTHCECTKEQIVNAVIYNQLKEYKPELFRQAVWGMFQR